MTRQRRPLGKRSMPYHFRSFVNVCYALDRVAPMSQRNPRQDPASTRRSKLITLNVKTATGHSIHELRYEFKPERKTVHARQGKQHACQGDWWYSIRSILATMQRCPPWQSAACHLYKKHSFTDDCWQRKFVSFDSDIKRLASATLWLTRGTAQEFRCTVADCISGRSHSTYTASMQQSSRPISVRPRGHRPHNSW